MMIVAAAWVYFAACGFAVDEMDLDAGNILAIMQPAPNIKGFYVRKEAIVGIVDWRTYRGIPCSSIYAQGTPHAVHVIGTSEEVIEKLRE